jgi:hypothetical protein
MKISISLTLFVSTPIKIEISVYLHTVLLNVAKVQVVLQQPFIFQFLQQLVGNDSTLTDKWRRTFWFPPTTAITLMPSHYTRKSKRSFNCDYITIKLEIATGSRRAVSGLVGVDE